MKSASLLRITKPGVPTEFPVPPVEKLGEPGVVHRRDKALRGWLKMHLREDKIEYLHAVGECTGRTFEMVVRQAINASVEEAERLLGKDIEHLVALSKEQRAEVQRHYRAVRLAAWTRDPDDGWYHISSGREN